MQLKGQTALCQCDTVGTLDTRIHTPLKFGFILADVESFGRLGLVSSPEGAGIVGSLDVFDVFEAEFYSGASRNTLRYAQCGGKQWTGRSQCEAGLLTELLWKSP